ncbi:MAG TPA: hypothetical protein VKX28_11290 [Xanthobacteraceae bacterium]|nr:hypothetical protein [Xanthobacteraceae bacterium]
MSTRKEPTAAEQITAIRRAAERLPNLQLENFYYNRWDRPMRVTARHKETGDVSLLELDFKKRKLRVV